jgi:hypothetical protein
MELSTSRNTDPPQQPLDNEIGAHTLRAGRYPRCAPNWVTGALRSAATGLDGAIFRSDNTAQYASPEFADPCPDDEADRGGRFGFKVSELAGRITPGLGTPEG